MIYKSTRNINLIYCGEGYKKPVITVENKNKWYSLFVVDINNNVYKLEDFYGWIDNCPKPNDLMEFALENDMYIDGQSLEMMIGRIFMEKEYQFVDNFNYENIV